MNLPILGPLLDRVVDKGAALISEFVTDKDEALRLEHEFRTQLTASAHELQTLELQIESDIFKAQQETIQAELHQTDLYTKRTRPRIARQSWYITAAYASLALFAEIAPVEWGLRAPQFQWEIFFVLASPALTYMGVRGLEKWKQGRAIP